jgi:hypothetical protein
LKLTKENGNWKRGEKQEKMKVKLRTLSAILGALIMVTIALGFTVVLMAENILALNSKLELSLKTNPVQGNDLLFAPAVIHTTVTYYKNGAFYAQYHHPGTVTKLGLNFTLGKISGYSTYYNMTQYLYNTTFVSIGNQGTLNSDSTVLPGEWNRTTGLIHDAAYNQFNVTAVFYPDTGPYTADCFGLNFGSGTIGMAYTLWGYDTFSEVTGIDDTFTINVEIQVSAS